MKKIRLALLFVTVSVNFFCSKNNGGSNTSTSSEDVVIGNYLAVQVPPNFVSGSAIVSKTGAGKYQFRPGTAAMPSFNFEYDPIVTFFSGSNFAYLIPKQNSNNTLLDSAYMTLYAYAAKTLSITLTSRATSTSWRYDGVKQ